MKDPTASAEALPSSRIELARSFIPVFIWHMHAGRPGGLVVSSVLLALVLEFDSHRGEILNLLAKMQKERND